MSAPPHSRRRKEGTASTTSSGANVKAVQKMLGHASAAMTLDTYADLFDDVLDAVAGRMQDAAALASSGKAWAKLFAV